MKTLVLAAILFTASFQFATAQTKIFLVRHAEKMQGGETTDPDLSEDGRIRAEALAKALKDANITAIYATEFKRTQQTAEPLAQALHLELAIIQAKETATLVTKLREAKGNALVVGHSNTLPDLIKALGVPNSITISDTDYDNMFIVLREPSSATLLRLHYH